MIVALVIACEIGFWVLIALGLAARYLARRPRLGAVLLALTPVVDLVLLAATALDLRSGATATLAHALAAVYLGFSVAYGHALIRWADVRVAHRLAGGPAPVRLDGAAYARACWADVVRSAIAVGLAAGVLWLLSTIAGDPARTEAFAGAYRILGIVLVVEIVWATSFSLWPRKPRLPAPTAADRRR